MTSTQRRKMITLRPWWKSGARAELDMDATRRWWRAAKSTTLSSRILNSSWMETIGHVTSWLDHSKNTEQPLTFRRLCILCSSASSLVIYKATRKINYVRSWRARSIPREKLYRWMVRHLSQRNTKALCASSMIRCTSCFMIFSVNT